METSQFHPKRNRVNGFTLLELVVAMFVLTVGMSAMACLVATSLAGTENARYMALATTLVSEKLEDLNKWPPYDAHVAAGGSLTSDSNNGSTNGSLNYYDDVDLSNESGQVSETIAISGGYSSVIHAATGVVTPSSNTAAPPTGAGVIDFHRRWLVESNPVVNGVTLTGSRRVTVEATLVNQNNGGAPVTFQLSVVRP